MVTREVRYAQNKTGYNAMVADFTDMFDWDVVEPAANDSYTEFQKSCDDGYIGLRVYTGSTDKSPKVKAVSCDGTHIYTAGTDAELEYVAYAYGNGFFAFCGTSNSLLPNVSTSYCAIGGVSTGRNIQTGETGWCSFMNSSQTTYYNSFDYYLLSKDSKASKITRWHENFNSKVGAAVSMHDPYTGYVSDKALWLTALPDELCSCLMPVIFNGVPYTRLGYMLLPAE